MAERIYQMAQDPDKDKKTAHEPTTEKQIHAEVITPSYLEMLSSASGFSLEIVDQQFTGGHAGMTDMRTKRIYLSRQHVEKMPAPAQRALMIHEAFHHNPTVVELQDMFEADLKSGDVIPSFIPDTPATREKYLKALRGHLHNALADVWLEAYAGRGAHAQIRSDLKTLYEDIEGRKTLMDRSKPEQLVQYLAGEARYGEKPDLSKFVDPDVATQLKRLESKGGMQVMQSASVFNSPFSTDHQKEQAIKNKYEMYRRLFLPAYNELLKAEAEKRNEEKQQQKGEGKGKGQKGKGKGGEKGEKGESVDAGERQQGFQDAMNDLLDDLTKSGEEQFGSRAPTKEEIKQAKEILEKIKEIADKTRGSKDAGKKEEGKETGKGETPAPPERSLQDIMNERAERAEQSAQESQSTLERGLGKQYGVDAAVIRKWNEIKQKHRGLIERAADLKAEIMIKDRQLQMQLPRREGEVIPGLESTTAIEIMSGNPNPETMQSAIRNPEFIQLRKAYIVDTSGSMMGGTLDKCIEFLVADAESDQIALRRIRDAGQTNVYSAEEEEAIAVNVTAFTTEPRLITDFDEAMNDKKEITIMSELPRVSGGTSETETIKKVYEHLRDTGPRTVKVMVVLSDGAGDGASTLAPIMQRIEKDQDVIFLAIGLGSMANQVVTTYTSALRKAGRSNVFAMESAEMNDNLLKRIIDFIGQQLELRAEV